MKRWTGTAAALVLGAVVGVGGAFGLGSRAEAAESTDTANACGRFECRTNKECTQICGGFTGFCRINSCESYCVCSG